MTRARSVALVVTSLGMLAGLAAVRAAMWADADGVWLFNHRFGAPCAFRQRFGVPCPNCGMSRSFVIALHGDLSQAAQLNPAGPLLLAGVVAAALVLLGAAAPTKGPRMGRWILPTVLIYSVLYVAVLIGHWLMTLP